MKGDELDYQIQAIQLNKIDEVSIEHSSDDSINTDSDGSDASSLRSSQLDDD